MHAWLSRSPSATCRISSHDAAHIALAENLGARLITRDAKLSRAPGIRCAIELL